MQVTWKGHSRFHQCITCHRIPFYNLLIFFSVCKTTIPELAKSLEKSIGDLQSRFGIPSNWSFAVIFSVIILRFSFFLDATFATGRWWAFVLLVKYHLSYICKKKTIFSAISNSKRSGWCIFWGELCCTGMQRNILSCNFKYEPWTDNKSTNT